MAHIIEYTHKREAQIKKAYEAELAKARNTPYGFSQIRGNELIETDFTDKELAELDKMVRNTLGKDYDIVYYKKDNLSADECKQSYITYGIIHKDLFKRANARYDKHFQTFCSADTNKIIIRASQGGYYSTSGYTWLIFQKNSNDDTILFTSDNVETFGIKPKYKKQWRKTGRAFRACEILFDKYLEASKKGIENLKQMFDKFK